MYVAWIGFDGVVESLLVLSPCLVSVPVLLLPGFPSALRL